MSSLLQGAGYSCGALVVGIAFGLFLTPYMLSCLGDSAYGVYALASLFAGWCGLLDFGLTTTTSRYITRYYTLGDEKSLNETGSTAIVLFGGIAALVFLLACGAFGIASLLGNRIDDTGLLGGALFFAGSSFAISKISDGFCGVIKGVLRQELTGGTVFVFRILFGIVNFAILFCGGRVIALFIGNFILTLLQLFVYIFLCRRAVPSFRFELTNFRKTRVRKLFSYSFFAFIAQAGEIAVNRSDLIVIAVLLSMSDVTRYNLVVVTLVSYFNSFLCEASSWETNWFTRLAAKDAPEEEGGKRVEKTGSPVVRYNEDLYFSRATILRASVYISIFMAFGVVAFGRAFIERWIGEEYLDAFPALATYMIAAGIYRGSAETNTKLLQGLARHHILAVAAILHGVLNILLSVFFIRIGLGLWGVALGSVIPGFMIYYCWIPNVVCRIIGERNKTYWLRQIHTTVIALTALLVPGWLATRFSAPAYWNLVLLASASGLIYILTLYVIGLTSRERETIADFLRKKLRR